MKQVILRFMACSDLHYKNDPACREKKRFEEGLRQMYAYADSQPYKAVDAVYIAGDFTDQGTMEQMTDEAFRLMVDVANGKQTKAESMGFVETAIARVCNYV